MDLKVLYQELIVEHGTQPRNCRALPAPFCSAEGINPLCGDQVKVYLNIEQGCVKDVTFEGSGCAISVASASMMTELLQGKSIDDVQALCEEFHMVLTHTEVNASDKLGKLVALAGVKAFPARVKCATLAWHTLLAAMKQKKEQKDG